MPKQIELNPSFGRKQRPGDLTEIANRTGYSVSYVSRVINGQRGQNQTIVKAANNLVSRRK